MATIQIYSLLTHKAVTGATAAFARLADIAIDDPRTALIADDLGELLAEHALELEAIEERIDANPDDATPPTLEVSLVVAFTTLEKKTRAIIADLAPDDPAAVPAGTPDPEFDRLYETMTENLFASMRALTAAN